MVKDKIIEKIRKVAERFRVEKVILFGSYARGTQTKRSDLDLIFIQETKQRFLDRIQPIFRELAYQLNLPLEIFVYTPREFKQMREANSHFIKRAVTEGKVIYEQRETKPGGL